MQELEREREKERELSFEVQTRDITETKSTGYLSEDMSKIMRFNQTKDGVTAVRNFITDTTRYYVHTQAIEF